MKKFIKFLEDNNAWENFEREFTKSKRNVKYYKDGCKRWRNRELDAAFPWDETEEGTDYWQKLEDKWKEENKSLKERLLSDD